MKPPPPCQSRDGKRYDFHVFTLGASRCSCCGWDRYESRKVGKP